MSARTDLPLPATRRVRKMPFVITLLLVGGALAAGARLHWRRDTIATATQRATMDYRPLVQTAVAQQGASDSTVMLPGTTQAFDQARIFARATGYVAERRVDIGSRVKAGDLLARIAAPDLDAQLKQAQATLGQRAAALLQAKANVSQAQSNEELANVTNNRIATLAKEGWATSQNADQTRLTEKTQAAAVASAQAAVTVAQADDEAQRATVEQLQQLTDFEKVTAPFDGIVTSRNVDTGDLVSGTGSGGTALFVLERDDVLRVHVDVPQSDAVGVKDGLAARVVLPERPNAPFAGTVARHSGSLAADTRTLPVEVDVRNEAHELSPGLFVDVSLTIPNATQSVIVPAGAIMFNGDGLQVAEVDRDLRVHMHPVSVYRDYGTTVELRDGLAGGERIVVNAPADLREGAEVRLRDSPSTGNGSPSKVSSAPPGGFSKS